MTVLKQSDTIVGPWNNEPDENQTENEDEDTGVDFIPGPNEISEIQEGHRSAVNNEPSANINEDISNELFS